MEQQTLYYTIRHSVNRYGTPEYRVQYLPPNYTSACRLFGVYRGPQGAAQAQEALLGRYPDALYLSAKEFSQQVLLNKQHAAETEPIILCVALSPTEFANLRTALARKSGIELDDEELRRTARHLAQLALRTIGDEAAHSQSDQHPITVTIDIEQFERFRAASAHHHGTAPQNFNTFLLHWSGQQTLTELINTYCDEAEQHQQPE